MDQYKYAELTESLSLLNACLDKEKIDAKLKELRDLEFEVKIKVEDAIGGQEDIIEKIMCIICFDIPYKPVECSTCNAIFCTACSKTHSKYSSDCPKCRGRSV